MYLVRVLYASVDVPVHSGVKLPAGRTKYAAQHMLRGVKKQYVDNQDDEPEFASVAPETPSSGGRKRKAATLAPARAPAAKKRATAPAKKRVTPPRKAKAHKEPTPESETESEISVPNLTDSSETDNSSASEASVKSASEEPEAVTAEAATTEAATTEAATTEAAATEAVTAEAATTPEPVVTEAATAAEEAATKKVTVEDADDSEEEIKIKPEPED
jgi:hypothetical protein